MATSFVVLGLVTIMAGACIGAFLKLSFAIRHEDRIPGSLRVAARTNSAQTARALVGVSSARWDQP